MARKIPAVGGRHTEGRSQLQRAGGREGERQGERKREWVDGIVACKGILMIVLILISSATAQCSMNMVQTAAKCDTQHRSASFWTNVIT